MTLAGRVAFVTGASRGIGAAIARVLAAPVPHGRMAAPEEHDHLVAYFATEEAAHITGQVIAVDGGQSQFMPLTPVK